MTKENLGKAWTHVKGVWKQGAIDAGKWLYDALNLWDHLYNDEEDIVPYEEDEEMRELEKIPHKEFEADFWGEDGEPGMFSLKTKE